MRIGVHTWGSEGDIRPFLALAHGLVKAGHQVRFEYVSVEGGDWAPVCRALGVAGNGIAAETLRQARESLAPRLRLVLSGEGNPITQVDAALSCFMDPIVEEIWASSQRVAEESDLTIAHFVHHPSVTASLVRGIPVVGVFTAPLVPTRHVPPTGLPDLGPLNSLSWKLADLGLKKLFLPRVNALRQRVGYPTLRSMFATENNAIALGLTCVSPTLLSRPADWRPEHRVTGFFNVPDVAQSWDPPPGFESFMAAGSPPVFMTFGSMMSMNLEGTAECATIMLEAAALTGSRTIIQAPWDQLPESRVSERIFKLKRAPHALVFPRCSVIVHHGGAGTTQSACRAGRPSVIVPFLGDQFFWALQLRKLGMAPAAVPRKRLTAAKLAARITEALGSATAASQAQAVGAKMNQEDGVACAVELIGRLKVG